MVANANVEKAAMVLAANDAIAGGLDPDLIAAVRADVDQILAAYREAGANERIQGAVAAMTAIKASVSATSPLWPLIEQAAALGLVVVIETLK